MPDYKSNVADIVKRVTDNLTVIKTDKKNIGEIAVSLQASNIKRIHNEGRAVDGSAIGRYSTKPVYVYPRNSIVDFKPIGKNGDEFFKNSKKANTDNSVSFAVGKNKKGGMKLNQDPVRHRMKYFEGGYKDFRNQTGRRIDFVNLSYTGKLSKEWIVEKEGDNYNIGFLTQRSALIAEGNEDRFGCKIYGVTKADEQVISLIVENSINNTLNGRRTG